MKLIRLVARPFAANARFWRRRRRTREWEQKRREFVYMDITSVTSLVAARHGSIPESFKDTLSVTQSSDAGGTISAPSGPGTPGLGVSTRLTSSRTSAQEVVRRAVIQGTFRSLRIGDTDLKLTVEDQPARRKAASVSTARELSPLLEKLAKQHRATRTTALLRGAVFEVQVELSPEWTYQFSTAASSMIDLIDGRSAMFGIDESTVAEVRHMLELLSRLLVDLVPVEAPIISHRLITIDNESWLVDASVITPGSQLDSQAETVHLAGVTELPLYWKDVRRVLFAGSAYTVYARLSKPGLQTSWSPVKLADVFDDFLPDVSTQIRQLPYLFSTAPAVSADAEAPTAASALLMEGLLPFGRALAQVAERKLDHDMLLATAHQAALSVTGAEELADVGIVRQAFEAVVAVVEAAPSIKEGTGSGGPDLIDRDLVRTLREAHQAIAQLTYTAALTQVPTARTAESATRLIEVEAIAIYW